MTGSFEVEYQSIELDCPPGGIRPWDLIVGVCAGTGLEVTGEPVPCTFGHAAWFFHMPADEWAKVQAIIKPRIIALHEQGTIRAGSW